MPGYIYCLTNDAIPHLVKIGKTRRDPVKRAEEISASTGVPAAFSVAWSRRVADPDRAERELHAALDACRLRRRREFFRCEPQRALAAARRLRSFRAAGSGSGSAASDAVQGLALASGTLAIFAASISFDLETATVAQGVVALGLGLTLAFQGVGLARMRRG